MYSTDLACVPTIFLEFRGQTIDACKLDATTCEEICLCYEATECTITEDGAKMDEVCSSRYSLTFCDFLISFWMQQMWTARRGCYLAASKVREQKGDSVYLSDTCVPISKLAESVAETEKDFVSNGNALSVNM